MLRTHPAIDDCLVFGTSDLVMRPWPPSSSRARPEPHGRRGATHRKVPFPVIRSPAMRGVHGRYEGDSAGKVRKQGIVAYFDERKEQAAPRHREASRRSRHPPHPGALLGRHAHRLHERLPHRYTDERNLLVDTGVSHEASYEVLRSALQDLRVDMARTDVRHALPHRSSGSDRGHRARRQRACIA